MKKIIKYEIWFLLIFSIVCYAWQGLELIIYKEIQPRMVDNIIGLILATSLYFNTSFLIKRYSIKIEKRICIRKGDKHFGRRMFIVHLLKNKCVYKWFSIYPWRIRL